MQITLETLRNKETRDALIDDLIGMKVAGHIATVLDFVPVAGRLPDNGRPVFGVQRSPLPGASLDSCTSEMMYVENRNAPLEPPSSWWLPGGLKPCWPVTHWAEIPSSKDLA